MSKKALILVDLQNDFCEGGGLAVPNGDEVIPLANQLQPHFDLVMATQDWHPQDHGSFAANHANTEIGQVIDLNGLQQILWPIHCVQGTSGAELHPQLDQSHIQQRFLKGTDKGVDSYSAFFDNAHRRSTGLGEYLKKLDVTDVYIMGLATDYCVKYSCLDAIHLGFNTHIIVDACRGVELKEGDSEAAIAEMAEKGVKLVTSNSLLPERF